MIIDPRLTNVVFYAKKCWPPSLFFNLLIYNLDFHVH